MNELSITSQYPRAKYNLLGSTDVMVSIPEIKTPTIQQVMIDMRPEADEVYVQQKAYRDKEGYNHPARYALKKNALKKLADKAGIQMISSEHVIPTTCQKCAAVNQSAGKIVQCGNCSNRDVAFRVTISVPQLTGENLIVEDTNEIIVENVIPGMSEKQKAEFLKHLPQICEAKALNGAIRTALQIKSTYTKEELEKPFIVAYLIPNLDNVDVKRAAIDSMFASSARVFGNSPSVQQIESSVPEAQAIEASDGENYDQYIDDTYIQEQAYEPQPTQQAQTNGGLVCSDCGSKIEQKVFNYSTDRFGRALCYNCQKKARGGYRQ